MVKSLKGFGWNNVGPALQTVAQHYISIGAMYRVIWRWWVGLHPLYEVHRRQVLNECWLAPAMVVEGIHVEDIFELVSFILSLIISWTFLILAHEEN